MVIMYLHSTVGILFDVLCEWHAEILVVFFSFRGVVWCREAWFGAGRRGLVPGRVRGYG